MLRARLPRLLWGPCCRTHCRYRAALPKSSAALKGQKNTFCRPVPRSRGPRSAGTSDRSRPTARVQRVASARLMRSAQLRPRAPLRTDSAGTPGFGAESGGAASVRPRRAGERRAEPRRPLELRRPPSSPAPPVPVPPAALGFRPRSAPSRRSPGRAWAAPVPGSCPAAAAPERPRGRAELLGSRLASQASRALRTWPGTASRGAASGRGGRHVPGTGLTCRALTRPGCGRGGSAAGPQDLVLEPVQLSAELC